jgi:hypothetical protein
MQLYKKVGKKYEPVPAYVNVDDEILMFCAFRYALGRMTYVVSTVVDALRAAAKNMHKITKEKYIQEILDYYRKSGNIGMRMDTEEWLHLACMLDEDNSYYIEANKHNTDEWVPVPDVYKYDGKFYDRFGSKYAYYHTVRNVKNNSEKDCLTEILKNESEIQKITSDSVVSF